MSETLDVTLPATYQYVARSSASGPGARQGILELAATPGACYRVVLRAPRLSPSLPLLK